MELLENSMLLGYVVAADYNKKFLMYYYAGASYSDDVIDTLQQNFEGWPIVLINDSQRAIALCNKAEITYQIKRVSGDVY